MNSYDENLAIFQTPFPDPLDGKIHTIRFLNASKGIVNSIEKLGKMFTPVKMDMNGNINKLNNKYQTNEESFYYLNDMILSEVDTNEIIATDALLWLSRGLHFIQRLFELLIEDAENSNKTEVIVPLFKTAYTDTLKPHHGWVAQQLFSLIISMCPKRSQVIHSILCSNEENGMPDERNFVIKMTAFTSKLKENLTLITQFYKEHDLESKIKS